MSSTSTISNLVKANAISNTLKKGSGSKTEIKALQNVLHDLGYDKELNWAKFGADGDYGGSTTAAMQEFLKRNSLTGDGITVSSEAANRMIFLHDIVDDLKQLQGLVEDDEVESNLFKGSRHKTDVVALQTVLNALGYGAELNWNKFGADGSYGGSSTAAVKAFGAKEGFATDGTKVTKDMVVKMIDAFKNSLGDDWYKKPSGGASTEGEFSFKVVNKGSKVYDEVSDGTHTVRFRRFRKGVYTFGSQKVVDFINSNKEVLEDYDITDSAMNVMVAVSENEGNLDAINTWDNSYMTFGMFQWTIGARTDAGELPSLFKKIKDAEPELFQKYYGKYGLDVHDSTDNVYGYLTLNGVRMRLASEKNQFRTARWCYIFWRAGMDPLIEAIEIEHALSRLKTFYWRTTIHGHKLSDIITSEYGVGLILDNHVNRPGYIKPCVRNAMTQTGLTDPTNWTTAEEMKVIDAYIKIRATYGSSPMTHANNRAATTKKYLNNGTISKERGSFEFTYVKSKDANAGLVSPPLDFQQNDYQVIKGFEDEFSEY